MLRSVSCRCCHWWRPSLSCVTHALFLKPSPAPPCSQPCQQSSLLMPPPALQPRSLPFSRPPPVGNMPMGVHPPLLSPLLSLMCLSSGWSLFGAYAASLQCRAFVWTVAKQQCRYCLAYTMPGVRVGVVNATVNLLIKYSLASASPVALRACAKIFA